MRGDEALVAVKKIYRLILPVGPPVPILATVRGHEIIRVLASSSLTSLSWRNRLPSIIREMVKDDNADGYIFCAGALSCDTISPRKILIMGYYQPALSRHMVCEITDDLYDVREVSIPELQVKTRYNIYQEMH